MSIHCFKVCVDKWKMERKEKKAKWQKNNFILGWYTLHSRMYLHLKLCQWNWKKKTSSFSRFYYWERWMKFGEKKSCTFVIIYIALWLVVVWSWLIIMKKIMKMLGKEGIYKNEFEVWIATKSYFIRLVIVITLDLEWMNWMEWVFNEIQWFLVFS